MEAKTDIRVTSDERRIKAKIFASPDKCMAGAELLRLRNANRLSREQLAWRLRNWGWYADKIYRYEKNGKFCLPPEEMQALLDALGASSI